MRLNKNQFATKSIVEQGRCKFIVLFVDFKKPMLVRVADERKIFQNCERCGFRLNFSKKNEWTSFHP